MKALELVTATGDTVVVHDTGGGAHYWPLSGQTAPLAITSFAVLLLGWSVYESTGAAPAVAQLQNGNAAGGDNVAGISLAAGATSNSGPSTRGVRLSRGLYLNVTSGSLTGAIYFRPLDE